MQITPSQIPELIKTVLKCMTPSVKVVTIKLPQRSAALYMRSEELPTVSDVQKTIALTDSSVPKHINTDGTTLKQQKLNSIAVNDLCLSVSEVPDGIADSVVTHIDEELRKSPEKTCTHTQT